eukprot:TRINITY_DN1926_c0_g1_i1.p1 TRINITY_DN1926_c0_g1~~TRINITY_DN1926_c0_g1_i1.p1  ORF type:complete len:412 (+),score=82.67 TRINITY_DN1926_c0_g1_i1:134-1369(+)
MYNTTTLDDIKQSALGKIENTKEKTKMFMMTGVICVGVYIALPYVTGAINSVYQCAINSVYHDRSTESTTLAIRGERTAEERTDDIYHKMKEDFVAPVTPKTGPVFPRQSLLDEFDDLLERDDFYIVYYGPSGSGKSVAISNLFDTEVSNSLSRIFGEKRLTHKRKGIIYLDLRRLSSEFQVQKYFAREIGYSGMIVDQNEQNFEDVLFCFVQACKMFSESEGYKPTLIVEDIHNSFDDASSLALTLVDYFSKGIINAVYVVSDYKCVNDLINLSGHGSRLEPRLFPELDESELVKYLMNLASSQQGVIEYIFGDQESLLSQDQASLIIQTLGTNVSDVLKCLNLFMKSHNLDKAISAVVETYEQRLSVCKGDIFAGDKQFDKKMGCLEQLLQNVNDEEVYTVKKDGQELK